MKIMFVVCAFPPETDGGTELEVQQLAHGALAQGHSAIVVAGTRVRADAGTCTLSESTDALGLCIVRIARPDRHPDHWQKSAHPGVTRAFRELLRREQPALVHLHHWQGLSRDLVHAAALEGAPTVVTLHDPWTSCLVGTRVRPDTLVACEVPLAANPCLACAQKLPPKTTWVPREAQFMLLAEHQAELARELDLARVCIADNARLASGLRVWLGRDANWPIEIVPLASSFDAHRAWYERALALGPPPVLRREDWYRERMRTFAIEEWDRGAARSDATNA